MYGLGRPPDYTSFEIRVTYTAIGGEELDSLHAAIIRERHGATAQQIGEQVGKNSSSPLGETLPGGTIIVGSGERDLGEAIEGVPVGGGVVLLRCRTLLP